MCTPGLSRHVQHLSSTKNPHVLRAKVDYISRLSPNNFLGECLENVRQVDRHHDLHIPVAKRAASSTAQEQNQHALHAQTTPAAIKPAAVRKLGWKRCSCWQHRYTNYF
eukprot:365123-Chlamydomonas_euryale.AAC.33